MMLIFVMHFRKPVTHLMRLCLQCPTTRCALESHLKCLDSGWITSLRRYCQIRQWVPSCWTGNWECQ